MYGGKSIEPSFFIFWDDLSTDLQKMGIDIQTIDWIQMCEEVAERSTFTTYLYSNRTDFSFFSSIAKYDSRIRIIDSNLSSLNGFQHSNISFLLINTASKEICKHLYIVGDHSSLLKAIPFLVNMQETQIIPLQLTYNNLTTSISQAFSAVRYKAEIVVLQDFFTISTPKEMNFSLSELDRKVRSLLPKNKISKALNLIHAYLHHHKFSTDDVILLQARYSILANEESKGLITREIANIEKLKLIPDILQLVINLIDDENFDF